jgi:succinoglycan biosynthesis transport protein ExoP
MEDNDDQLIRAQDTSRLPAYYAPPVEAPPSYQAPPAEEDRVSLLDYWRVIVKRRWVIFCFALAVVVVTAIATWKATPVYRATIKLQIDPEQQSVLPFKEALDPGSTYAQSQEYLQTQFKVLESKSLAERVIKALNLENNPVFVGNVSAGATSRAFQWLRETFGLTERSDKQADAASLEERKLARLVKIFGDNLTTSPIRNSRLVDVNFESRDPRLAAEVANTLAKEYIGMNFETKYNATNAASDFLSGRLVDLKARVEKSEEDLVCFSRRHNIYTIGDKENVILQKLADLNTALTAAQSDRIQKESVWNIVQQAAPGNYPDILRNDLIKTLEAGVSALRLQKTRLEAQFKPGWPELDQVTGQLADSEEQLAQERQRAIKNAEIEYRTAMQREKLLTQALQAQKAHADTFNQNSIQYNILKRQVDTDKQLYDGLLQRMKEAGVSAGLQSNNIHVVDTAKVPRSPHSPNKPLNLSLALAIGLMLGTGLAFFIEFLDSSVKTPDDVDRYIKLPSLGVIPALGSVGSAKNLKVKLLAVAGGDGSNGNGSNGNGSKGALPANVEVITYHDTKSLISEAYRNLRTSVLLSSGAGHPPKVLLVTSSQRAEGKTTTAVNIAITLAQNGDRVVLLDCDMRNPRVHRILGMSNSAGMSSFLSGNSDLSGLIQESEVTSLFAISSGPIPPNPAELVGSARMKQALLLLAESFDRIVIDSPPVLAVTDARILAPVVDGVILVIKGGETPKEAVQRTKRLLQEVHGRLIGTLLNNVDVRSADYYYYSRYYYYGYGRYGRKYGYGYGYGNEKDKEVSSEAS